MTDSLKEICLQDMIDDKSNSDDSLNLSNSYLSSSSDDDIEFHLLEACVPYTKRVSISNYVVDVVRKYSDKEFIRHFRINRMLFEFLVNGFKSTDEYKTLETSHRVKTSECHVLLFLWFAGHERCSFHDLSDRFDVSISTVHVILKRVVNFISGMSKDYMTWPNANEMENTASHYVSRKGFPHVIGSIDGTHIRIDPPRTGKDEYFDRKGDITLHLQGVCNEDNKFIDIFVGYPGSVHDARVLQNSELYSKLSRLCAGYYLLGDSAYPCLDVLMTPYKDNGHLTNAQKQFNMRLSSYRVDIEHTFGILKQRFRQLYYCKLQGIQFLCHFIRACCVLHNLSSANELDFSQGNADDDANDINDTATKDTSLGKKRRDDVCNTLLQ